jgi:hypothetical protein
VREALQVAGGGLAEALTAVGGGGHPRESPPFGGPILTGPRVPSWGRTVGGSRMWLVILTGVSAVFTVVGAVAAVVADF